MLSLRGARFLAPLALVCLSAPAVAQYMVDPLRTDADDLKRTIDRRLAAAAKNGGLACHVHGQDPWLNFAFRYQAGYRASIPLRQFPTDPVRMRVLLRVTPAAGGGAYYFWQSFNLGPGRRPGGVTGSLSGGYFLGEGAYRVDWMLYDQFNRACYRHWTVDLRLKEKERDVADFMEPGTVSPITLTWEGTNGEPQRPFRIAVILHASPIRPRSICLTRFDQSFLTTVLTTLLEDTPFRESSVDAINLMKQEVIFESRELGPLSFRRLVDAMGQLNLGTIGIDEYSNPAGHVHVLADLVNRLVTAANPPDAIVFIGPNSRQMKKFPRRLVEDVGDRMPLFFYLHLDFNPRRFPWPDTIERLTKSLGGKVFAIRHPRQLVKAIDKMEELLARSDAGG